MGKPFLIGDSHARGMAETMIDGSYELRGWHVLGIGGSTAHNLVNDASETAAGRTAIDLLDKTTEQKDIYMMFGDVDCANHLLSEDMVEATMARYKDFCETLRRRHDVSSVHMCHVYPRTSAFYMHGRDSKQIMETIGLWNSRLLSPVDTHGPLLGPDGFLLPSFAHNNGDSGERHLSKIGSDAVWEILIAHHNR
jgi:hypothetical protein